MWDDGGGYCGEHLIDERLVLVFVRGNSIERVVRFAPSSGCEMLDRDGI